MAGSIFDEPPSQDELDRAKRARPAGSAPPRQAPAAPGSIFDEAPTQDEMIFAKTDGRTRLSPEQAAELARRQGFDDSSRGVVPAFARGVGRFGAMIPAMIPEMAHGLAAVTYYGIGNAVNALDSSVPAPVWSRMPKIQDTVGQIPGVREFTAENWYNNVVGPGALNIYPHRRPDETTAEMWAGSAGEQLPAALGARSVMRNSVAARTGPLAPAGRPYQSAAQAQRLNRNIDRITAAEYGGAVIGGEIGAEMDRAQGGTGDEGRAYGSLVGGVAPTAIGAAGTTARFALRGGSRGRQEVADAIAASDQLSDMAGQTYQPTRTQRVLDAIGGGSGRPVNLTAGQAAPRRGLVRMIERVASYFPGGYPVLANKIASQLEQAGQAVTQIANRAVERFNREAAAENAQRLPRQTYQMQVAGRGPTSALDETIPQVAGVTDEAAGQAIDRGLRERVAMNDNLRRLAEAEFQTRMPADTPISMDGTIRALEDLEVRMPNAPSVSQGTLRSPVIGNLREELLQDAVSVPGGGVTIPFQVLRRVRERVGQFLQGDNNALGPARLPEADARRLYAALTEDMATAARQAGPETWLSWQTTQAVTRAGVDVAGDVSRVLRPETWETLFTSVQSGQGSRVRDIMDALPARDRDMVVANVFRRFGAASPGNQDAFGTAWSFDRWLTNVNAARQRGALEALTGTGARETAEAVDALNRIAERVRERSRFMPNPSGTGRVALTGGTVLAAAAAGLTNPLMAAAVLATGFVAPNVISRLMVNPRFIRWLAKLDETPPSALAGHVLRLGSLATSPETAAGVQQFTDALMRQWESGDTLDRMAMVDPTPLSETARQVKAYAVDGRPMTSSNLLASAGAIGLATLGAGAAKAKAAKALTWTPTDLRPVSAAASSSQDAATAALTSGKYDLSPMQYEMSLIEDVYKGNARTKVSTVLDLARDQDARAAAAGASDALREKTEQALTNVVAIGTREALEAIARNSEAAQWYRKSVTDAVEEIAKLHPQIKSDPLARARFMFGLAMTSNGQDVASNARYAEWVHDYYTRVGAMPESIPFGGDRKPQIEKALRQWNVLSQQMGGEKLLVEFMARSHKIGDLKKMGFDVAGENVDVMLPGSVIFGPKVGAGFYSNLMGNFDVLTMDLWFMRTWGRRTGKLHVPMSGDQFNKQMDELRRALKVKKGAASRMAQFDPSLAGKQPADLTDEEMVELARKIYAADMRSGFAKYRGKRPEYNKKAQRLVDGMERVLDQPGSGMDRKFQREAYTRILNNLRAEGIDISMADLQALDWYPEKELFARRGVGNARAAPTDYATEFRKLVSERLHGKTTKP